MPLPVAAQDGWQLKRYAILAEGREVSDEVVAAATAEAFRRLPAPGALEDGSGNHGVGFQIIHFAQVAVVSPVFYWQWGSVLAHVDQMRAGWEAPTEFGDGKAEVFGCVWELSIVTQETAAWTETVLHEGGAADTRLAQYLDRRAS